MVKLNVVVRGKDNKDRDKMINKILNEHRKGREVQDIANSLNIPISYVRTIQERYE